MKKDLLKSFLLFFISLLFINCRVNVEKQRNYIQPVPFEKTKWFAFDEGLGREVEWEFRPKIAKQLVLEKSLIGKNRTQIIERLGNDANEYQLNIVEYKLEEIYGSNIDPIAIEYLKITFNAKNIVENAEIKFHKTGDWRD